MIIKEFVELCAPEEFVWIGDKTAQWFVSGVMKDIYLHNNCVVHDTCGEVTYDNSPTTSGWYKTESEAFVCVVAYYAQHGLKYPHSMSDDNTYNTSKIMNVI